MKKRDTVRVGITGHRPGRRIDAEVTRCAAEAAVDAIAAKWRNVILVAGGATGFDQFVCCACVRRRIPFELVLPCLPEVFTAFWTMEQRLMLVELCKRAIDVHVINEHITPSDVTPAVYHSRNAAIVRRTDRIVAYWDGRRRGGTWWTILHALEEGKPVTNAFGQLRLISRESIGA